MHLTEQHPNARGTFIPDFLRCNLVNVVITVVLLVLFVGINSEPTRSSLDEYIFGANTQPSDELLRALFRWGAPSMNDMRNGHLWGLVTCNFLEAEFLWLFFDILWLWTLGRFVKQRVGTPFYVWLIVSTCVFASALQIAIADKGHYGFGAITYSLFGFVWVNSMLGFREWKSRPDVGVMFLFWAVISLAATYTQIYKVAYFSFFFGFLWGALLAYLRSLRAGPAYLKWVMQAVIPLLLLGLCSASLFWAPWSVDWLSHEAAKYHAREDYDRAESLYQRILKKAPTNEFARQGRDSVRSARVKKLSGEAYGYHKDGNYEHAKGLYTRILELEPGNEFAKGNLKRIRVKELDDEFKGLYSAHKYDDARRVCSEMLELDTENDWARECLERLPEKQNVAAGSRLR